MLEIDVDIGRFAPFRRDETLEEEIGQRRIDLGDADAETDRGIGRRAAPLAQNVLRAGIAHDVMHGQEIGRVVELGDQRQFVADLRGDLVRDRLAVAVGRALPRKPLQFLLRRALSP
jgi:hypothetical protein